MMAFLGRYGSVSPDEFDAMDPQFSMAYAKAVARLREQEIDLQLNIAKFQAGARVGGGEEVR